MAKSVNLFIGIISFCKNVHLGRRQIFWWKWWVHALCAVKCHPSSCWPTKLVIKFQVKHYPFNSISPSQSEKTCYWLPGRELRSRFTLGNPVNMMAECLAGWFIIKHTYICMNSYLPHASSPFRGVTFLAIGLIGSGSSVVGGGGVSVVNSSHGSSGVGSGVVGGSQTQLKWGKIMQDKEMHYALQFMTFLNFYSGTWPFDLMDLLSLRLAGEVEARIDVKSSCSQPGFEPGVSRLQAQSFNNWVFSLSLLIDHRYFGNKMLGSQSYEPGHDRVRLWVWAPRTNSTSITCVTMGQWNQTSCCAQCSPIRLISMEKRLNEIIVMVGHTIHQL